MALRRWLDAPPFGAAGNWEVKVAANSRLTAVAYRQRRFGLSEDGHRLIVSNRMRSASRSVRGCGTNAVAPAANALSFHSANSEYTITADVGDSRHISDTNAVFGSPFTVMFATTSCGRVWSTISSIVVASAVSVVTTTSQSSSTWVIR